MIGRKPQVVNFVGTLSDEGFWGCAGHLLNIIPEEVGGILLGAKIETVPRIHRAIAMMFGRKVATWLLQNQKVTFGLGGQYIPRECFIPSIETIMFNHKVGKAGKILIMSDLYGNPYLESEIMRTKEKLDELRFGIELRDEYIDRLKKAFVGVVTDARGEDEKAISARFEDLLKFADIYSIMKETKKEKEPETRVLERKVKDLEEALGRAEESLESKGLLAKSKEGLKKIVGRE